MCLALFGFGVRFNEDCKYAHCGYREHQTHFHCMRPDCGYSFCDKTRFVQHTARHERLDTLMGGDFQQFRANVPCGRQECVYTSTLGKQTFLLVTRVGNRFIVSSCEVVACVPFSPENILVVFSTHFLSVPNNSLVSYN